jgi:hypothetical protein
MSKELTLRRRRQRSVTSYYSVFNQVTATEFVEHLQLRLRKVYTQKSELKECQSTQRDYAPEMPNAAQHLHSNRQTVT